MYNIASKRVTDRTLVERNFTDSVRRGAVGAMPGGGSSLPASRQFIAQKTGVTPTETSLKSVRSSTGASQRSGFVPVKPEYQTPDTYRVITERVRTTVGATAAPGTKGVRASLGQGIARPESDRAAVRPDRGLAPTPAFRGADKAQVQTWAPRAREAGGGRPAAGGSTLGTTPRDTVRPTVRPEAVRPTDAVRPGVERPAQQAQPAQQPEPRQPTFERRPPAVETRVAPQERPVEQERAVPQDRFERQDVDPDVGLPVDRTIRRDDRVRSDRETVSPTWQRPAPAPEPRVVQPQPSRPQAAPQDARPRPEVRAPQPDVRREVPREVVRPRSEDRPSRPSMGGGSSGGSSAPPVYTPPKPRSAPAAAPSRGDSDRRRFR
jgi:hypothetical protein